MKHSSRSTPEAQEASATRFGSFENTRRVLLIISGTATALILWLSLSFWYDAWTQHRDASAILQDVALENLIFDAARKVANERLYTASSLVSAGDARHEQHLAALREARIALDSDLERLLGLPQIGKPDSTLTLDPSEIQRLKHLEQPFSQLMTARNEIDNELTSLKAGNQTFTVDIIDVFATVIEALEFVHDDTRSQSNHGDITLDNHQRMHSASWSLSEAVSQNAALLTPLVTEHMALDRDVYARSFSATHSATQAWDQLQTLALAETNDSELTAALENIREVYTKQFKPARESLLSQSDESNNIDPIDSNNWLATSQQTLTAIVNFDTLLSSRTEQYLSDTVDHAVRRLIIDTLLILICAALVLASYKLLKAIRHQTTHDRLTGLANRGQFERQLDQRLDTAERNNSSMSLFYFDLINFTQINDSLGYETGDRLLRVIGNRLSNFADSPESTARLDGDEFAVLVNNASTTTADELLDFLTTTIELDGLEHDIGISMGVAEFSKDRINCRDLLNQATIAMHECKRVAGSATRYFDEEMAARFRERAAIERELADAIDNDQLSLHFQPQVDLTNGCVTGLEALVRWTHPTRGFISPAVFIPIAEESGLIHRVGPWVLNEACRQAAQWQREHDLTVRVAVNISAEQFALDNFTQTIFNALEQHALAAQHLEVEVTESVVMTALEPVVERLDRLREHGIKVAIDDFGTGYSSLSYLDQLPLDYLKIDQAFVQRLDITAPTDSLVHKIQLLADSFGLATVVEGVETKEQLAIVTEMGCDIVQGYVHSKPVAASEVPETIIRIETELKCRAA